MRYEDVDIGVRADRDRVRLLGLSARGHGGKIVAEGVATRLRERLHFRYELEIIAHRVFVPLDDPLSTTFIASLSGLFTPERITSDPVQPGDEAALADEAAPSRFRRWIPSFLRRG